MFVGKQGARSHAGCLSLVARMFSSAPNLHHTPGPEDPNPPLGAPQFSSLRPSSAKYSIPRDYARAQDRVRAESPGPASYDYPSALSLASATIGHGPKNTFPRPAAFPDAKDRLDAAACDRSRLPSSARAVFGRESRTGGRNAEEVRTRPEVSTSEQDPSHSGRRALER